MSSSVTAGVEATVLSGSLLVAVPVAVAAGVVSFLSPCVLPLVPGYLSYMTGLIGTELVAPRRGRLALAAGLFVAGFTAVFASFGALFGGLGAVLLTHQSAISRVLGGGVVLLGLTFLGWGPALQRERRLRLRSERGLAGAPLLGVTFGLGWTPCIGPALAAVQTLAFTEASASRGTLLSVAYALGLGIPFLVVGFAAGRTAGAIGFVRRHRLGVTRLGGAFLIAIGALVAAGVWNDITLGLRIWAASFTPVI